VCSKKRAKPVGFSLFVVVFSAEEATFYQNFHAVCPKKITPVPSVSQSRHHLNHIHAYIAHRIAAVKKFL
jgi:hypothetical protein